MIADGVAPPGRARATVRAAGILVLLGCAAAAPAGPSVAAGPSAPCVVSAPAPADPGPAGDRERARAFAEATGRCMMAMHAEMHAGLAAGGDADARFAAAKIPHHQGAVDMARQILLHGRDPQLRSFARSVIVEQQAEIEMLRGWAARRAVPATPAAAPHTHPRR
ncbi:MAG TPA: DUF305 domain-containing protein [Longimicrobiaceae bacterium]